MISRRTFFGAAAATSVAAALPGRAFARSLEDRYDSQEPPKWDSVVEWDQTDVIFRLYDGEDMVYAETFSLPYEKDGEVTLIGKGSGIVIKDFTGTADRITVALSGMPLHEIPLEVPKYVIPLRQSKNDTLTLDANTARGFIALT